MQKSDLNFFFKEVIPELPDPYEFSGKIMASIGFIHNNPDAGPSEVTEEMLDLWSVPQEQTAEITSRFINAGEPFANLNTLSSFIIFAYLYLRRYRLGDFGDFENFIYMYGRFQTMLNCLKKIKQPYIPENIRLFDLNTLDTAIEAAKQKGAI